MNHILREMYHEGWQGMITNPAMNEPLDTKPQSSLQMPGVKKNIKKMGALQQMLQGKQNTEREGYTPTPTREGGEERTVEEANC